MNCNLLSRITGDTCEEKLKNAKDVLEMMEKEIFKLRAELKRSELTIKKLQESVGLQAQNQNNTSSDFLLPSEFKKNWEIFVQENILDVFGPFLENHNVFVRLIQNLLKIVIDNAQSTIDYKVNEILKILGITKDNFDNLKKYLIKLFQNHCNSAIPLINQTDFMKRYIEKSRKYVKDKYEKEFNDMINSSEFKSFVQTAHELILYMLFHDPPLDLKFSEKLDYKIIDKADDYYCIDGFPKNSPPCVIVVPIVMRGNHPYQGIKPSVLVISPDQI